MTSKIVLCFIFNHFSHTFIGGKFGTGYPNDGREGNPKLVCFVNPNSIGLPNNVSFGLDCLMLCSAGIMAEENSGP